MKVHKLSKGRLKLEPAADILFKRDKKRDTFSLHSKASSNEIESEGDQKCAICIIFYFLFNQSLDLKLLVAKIIEKYVLLHKLSWLERVSEIGIKKSIAILGLFPPQCVIKNH